MNARPVNYRRLWFEWYRHHARFVKFVESKKLTCQECGGAGGERDVILDDGTGPWEQCGFCEGTGFVTPHIRGLWLRWKRQEATKRDQMKKNEAS